MWTISQPKKVIGAKIQKQSNNCKVIYFLKPPNIGITTARNGVGASPMKCTVKSLWIGVRIPRLLGRTQKFSRVILHQQQQPRQLLAIITITIAISVKIPGMSRKKWWRRCKIRLLMFDSLIIDRSQLVKCWSRNKTNLRSRKIKMSFNKVKLTHAF